MGRGQHSHEVYLIDFGLASRYRSPHTGHHILPSTGRSLVGTAYYSSIPTHLGIQQTRRDDLEALGYLLISFAIGHLPWLGIQSKNLEQRHQSILRTKLDYSPQRLCQGLPDEFLRYLRYCRSLGFSEDPDYIYLRTLFRTLAARQGIAFDRVYDWSSPPPPPPPSIYTHRIPRSSSSASPTEWAFRPRRNSFSVFNPRHLGLI